MSAHSDVRVLTWNVQHANAARTHRQARWLAAENLADVLVLTEVAAGATGDLLAGWLTESGYTVHLPDAGEGDGYRVLLACRAGVVDVIEIGVTVLPHRCVAARVVVSDLEIGVVGLYVPSRGPREKRNVAKRAFQEAVAAALPAMAARHNGTPVVITGDLNVVEPRHDPRYPVFGDWEYGFYQSFIEHGFDDAFRVRRSDGMDYSWFGRPNSAGRRNGYRFDHTFITAAYRDCVRDCRYLHAVRENGLSDHSAMELTLVLSPTRKDAGCSSTPSPPGSPNSYVAWAVVPDPA